MENAVRHFRIAIAGPVSDDSLTDLLSILEDIKSALQAKLPDETVALDILSMSTQHREIWETLGTFFPISSPKLRGNENEYLDKTDELSHLLNLSDFFVAFWNETMDKENAPVGGLLQFCCDSGLPCAWCSPQGKRYWAENAIYEPYTADKIKEQCAVFSSKGVPDAQIVDGFGKRFIRARYSRYMKKFKANNPRKISEEDDLVERDDIAFSGDRGTIYSSIFACFKKHDEAAISLAEDYRSSIHWRSILPLAATIFLALGFYVEALMPVFFGKTPAYIWTALAGITFFLHGFSNLHAYRLSKNQTILRWHTDFLQNRVTAEILRLIIHLFPFGVPLNLASLMYRCGLNLDAKKNREIFTSIHKTIEGESVLKTELTGEARDEVIVQLNNLVSAQLWYHTKTISQYTRLIRHLKTWGKVIFIIGFGLVLARGGIQLVLTLFQISGDGPSDIPTIRTFANAFALFIPAWAAFFTGRLSLCNYESIVEENITMCGQLQNAKALLQEMKEKGDALSYQMLYSMIEKIASLMLFDVAQWNLELHTKKVTHI